MVVSECLCHNGLIIVIFHLSPRTTKMIFIRNEKVLSFVDWIIKVCFVSNYLFKNKDSSFTCPRYVVMFPHNKSIRLHECFIVMSWSIFSVYLSTLTSKVVFSSLLLEKILKESFSVSFKVFLSEVESIRLQYSKEMSISLVSSTFKITSLIFL